MEKWQIFGVLFICLALAGFLLPKENTQITGADGFRLVKSGVIKEKIGAYEFKLRNSDGSEFAKRKVVNRIDMETNTLLDCDVFTCDYKIEIAASKPFNISMSDIEGKYRLGNAKVERVFHYVQAEEEYQIPTLGTVEKTSWRLVQNISAESNESEQPSYINETYSFNETIITGYETAYRNISVESEDDIFFSPGENKTIHIIFSRQDMNPVDVYDNLFGADYQEAAWWNDTWSNKQEINVTNWICNATYCQFPIEINKAAQELANITTTAPSATSFAGVRYNVGNTSVLLTSVERAYGVDVTAAYAELWSASGNVRGSLIAAAPVQAGIATFNIVLNNSTAYVIGENSNGSSYNLGINNLDASFPKIGAYGNFTNSVNDNTSHTDYSLGFAKINVIPLPLIDTNGSDIRIVNSDENATLPFFREDNFDTANKYGRVWVNSTNNTSRFYLYYNSTGGSDASNGDGVFRFFDGFNNGTSLTAGKWTGDTGSASVSGGMLTQSSGKIYGTTDIPTPNGGYSAVGRVQLSDSSAHFGFEGTWDTNVSVLNQETSTAGQYCVVNTNTGRQNLGSHLHDGMRNMRINTNPSNVTCYVDFNTIANTTNKTGTATNIVISAAIANKWVKADWVAIASMGEPFPTFTYGATSSYNLNCSSINASGSYSLTSNLSIDGATCFNITAENVTLNCNGFSITGNNTINTYGIYSNQANTTIRNCVIRNFARQVFLSAATNSTIDNVTAYAPNMNNSYGFYVTGTPTTGRVLINNSYANLTLTPSTLIGVPLYVTNRVTINNSVFESRNVSTTYATCYVVGTAGSAYTYFDNTVCRETLLGRGLYASTGSYSRYTNSNFTGTGSSSYGAQFRDDDGYVSNCNFYSASSSAVYTRNGDRLVFENNVLNGTIGLSLGGINTNLTNNTIVGRTGTGITYLTYSSANSRLVGNSITGATNAVLDNVATFNSGVRYENNTFTGGGANPTVYLQTNVSSQTFIGNTFRNTGTGMLVRLNANSGSCTFYWNNFTGTTGLYINDSNGSNFYNTTEGNIWEDVINGSVEISGSAPSAYGSDFYVGSGGAGYPYNGTTSPKFSCLFDGCGDYAPLIYKPPPSVSFGSGISSVQFRPVHAYKYNVLAVNETESVPLFNVTNNGNYDISVTANISAYIPKFSVRCASNYSGMTYRLNTTSQVIGNISGGAGNWAGVWCWADFDNPDPRSQSFTIGIGGG